MRVLIVALMLSLATLASFQLTAEEGPLPPRERPVLISEDLGRLTCEELGIVDEAVGTMDLRQDCSCDSPHRVDSNADQLEAHLESVARDRGANAVWVLEEWSSKVYKFQLELCCFVEGWRSVSLLYSCPEEELEEARIRMAYGSSGSSE